MSDEQEYAVISHESLQRKPRTFGVGIIPLVIVFMLVWLSSNIFGWFTIPTAAAFVIGSLIAWGIKIARSYDDFAVEGFILSIFAPGYYARHPHVKDPPQKPSDSIPSHLSS